MPTVTNKTLEIPLGVSRPGFDTKILIHALSEINGTRAFLDMGCGSGAVAIAAAKKGMTVTASDISGNACAVTKKNAVNESVSISVVQSDLFQNVHGVFDVVAFNPPYGSGKLEKGSAVVEFIKSLIPRENSFIAETVFHFIRHSRHALITRFLREVSEHLSQDGTVLILLHKSETDEILRRYDGRILDEAKWMRLVKISASSLARV